MGARVLIADGQGFYRHGIRAALESVMSNVEILEADCLDAMLARLDENSPIQVCMIDLQLPGLLSIGLLRDVVALYPRIRFAVLSASMARSEILTALATGLHGFICKLQTDDEVIQAVSDLLSGRIYVPPVIAAAPAVYHNDDLHPEPSRLPPAIPVLDGVASTRDARPADLDRLTPRQREVLNLIAEGLPNKEIARKLHISEATTKIHAGALMRVLGVRNRTEAAVLLRRWVGERC